VYVCGKMGACSCVVVCGFARLAVCVCLSLRMHQVDRARE